MPLKLNTASGGSVTLDPANTASNFTLTVPATTGTLDLQGPAFSAYQSSAQSINAATYTKVQLQTEEFDTANCFDSTTNYRFTPNVAGYYQVNGAFGALGGTYPQVVIYKNGSAYKSGTIAGNSNVMYAMAVSALVYLNGSTDYIELYTYATNANTGVTGVSTTYFQAVLVRAA